MLIFMRSSNVIILKKQTRRDGKEPDMIFGLSFPEVDKDKLEERIAILKAVKCPGKTHGLIKSKELRDAFARELNDYRNQRLRGKKQHGSWFPPDYEAGLRTGFESAFWAMQKDQNRAFLCNGGRPISWQLVEAEVPPSAEYQQYEAAVIAVHQELRTALAKIEADFASGVINEKERTRACLKEMNREDRKILELQAQYAI
jgi:hypothetical protein